MKTITDAVLKYIPRSAQWHVMCKCVAGSGTYECSARSAATVALRSLFCERQLCGRQVQNTAYMVVEHVYDSVAAHVKRLHEYFGIGCDCI